MKQSSPRLFWSAAAIFLTISPCAAQKFRQKNLVSDVPGLAKFTDPDLKNPWGISEGSTTPFWVSDEVTGKSTLYNSGGTKLGLVVDVVGGHPTGTFFNANSANFQGDRFLFATLNGTINGWQPASGTTAIRRVDNSGAGASYTGLTTGNNGSGNFIFAADSANNRIDVFDSNFTQQFGGFTFTDPTLGAGFSVYNIQNLAGTLVVTYENETSGGGIVDAFDVNGNLIRRVTGNANGGPLDSPWGLAIAPSSFGKFGGALLVGNENSGMIDAFNMNSGDFLGTLKDVNGNPLVNAGTWGLQVGNGALGGDSDKLYFAAGILGEQHGLFGSIQSVPEFSTAVPLLSMIVVGAGLRRRRRRQA